MKYFALMARIIKIGKIVIISSCLFLCAHKHCLALEGLFFAQGNNELWVPLSFVSSGFTNPDEEIGHFFKKWWDRLVLSGHSFSQHSDQNNVSQILSTAKEDFFLWGWEDSQSSDQEKCKGEAHGSGYIPAGGGTFV